MSDRGVITEWDLLRAWGAIRLDTGEVLQFDQNACGKGVVCAVGTAIWVAQHVPYVEGQRRATSVQATAGEPSTAGVES